MDSAQKGMDPALRGLALLLVVVFINIAGFSLLLPLLPFLGQAFGASPVGVTLLFSAYSLGSLFGEPYWGRMSDRIGRKRVLTLSISCAALSYVGFAFAPDFWTALAIRAVSGFFSGNLGVVQGYIADITPPEKRAGRIGFFGAAFNLGFVAGPAIGGLLAQPELGAAGFRPPILAAAAFAGLAAVAAFVLLPEIRPQARPGASVPLLSRSEARRLAFYHPVIGRTILIGFLAVWAFASMESVFGLWTEARFGWNAREVGLAFVAIGLAGAITQAALVGPLSRRFGEARMVVAGMAALGTSMILQPLLASPVTAIALMAMLVFGHSLAFPNISALISRSSPANAQGSILGIHMAAGAFARIVGPPAVGAMFELVGRDTPYFAGAGLMLFALLAALQLVRVRDAELARVAAGGA